MEPPDDTVFDECGAGIDIFGFAQGNVVLGNRVRGRAGVALVMHRPAAGSPNSAFVPNRCDDFKASIADVFVGDGALNTRIVGPGTVADHGKGTVIVPVPF